MLDTFCCCCPCCSCLLLLEHALLAPGSEDNTVRLWNAGGSCLQVLEHPGCVWSVAFTQRGELASGCSDAVGRVWSNDPQRKVRQDNHVPEGSASNTCMPMLH